MLPNETFVEKVERKLEKKRRIIRAAAGKEKADIVLKNADYLNVFSNEFCHGDIAVAEGVIVGMGEYSGALEIDATGKIICPGFIDAHIHLESALVKPVEFARAVLPHGTTTVITDPHEIANVMGLSGIDYMLESSAGLPVDVQFMLPSCVPSTPQDESGDMLDYRAIDPYFEHPRVLGLAEMMDYVSVTRQQPETIGKILCSQAHHKKIDGHAPGLSGNLLNAYIAAGVYSDHECFTAQNALEKLRKGQFIMVREGTAAKNLKALLPLLTEQYYSRLMFCTDDKHPSDLLHGGHIDSIVHSAIAAGVDPVIALKVGSHNAARYFLMNNKGAIAPGYRADIVMLDDLEHFEIEMVMQKGRIVCEKGKPLQVEEPQIPPILTLKAHDTVHVPAVTVNDFQTTAPLACMKIVPRELVTENAGFAEKADTARDILKICVVERHHSTGHIGIGYIQGYGLKSGAVATTIAHDSHNIIVVGANDADIADAVNRLRSLKGGIVVMENGVVRAEVALPVAGLMSDQPLQTVNEQLERAKAEARKMGVHSDIDPFMTLSFMSLTVIPEIRVTTKGMFDVNTQEYI